MSDLNIRPVSTSQEKKKSRPVPTESLLKPWKFDYSPSPDGNDLNLLILFHGLGDTKASFSQLAKNLNLPSTATLSLQAPDPIPLLEDPAFSWYNTFTPFFEPLPNPNPTTVIPPLRKVLEALTSPEVGWEPRCIHLFGYAQGGTTALELALDIGKNGIGPSGSRRLGSVTSICGPLLSFPASELQLQTPICYFTRSDSRSAIAQKAERTLKRAFGHVDVIQGTTKGGEDMPRGKEEWTGIMKFWGENLDKSEGWKGAPSGGAGGEIYEVMR